MWHLQTHYRVQGSEGQLHLPLYRNSDYTVELSGKQGCECTWACLRQTGDLPVALGEKQ